jgi:uncharacterized protein (TIGR02271 family)
MLFPPGKITAHHAHAVIIRSITGAAWNTEYSGKGEHVMMHREEFLKKHPNIKGSMIAYNESGEKLGKVTTLFEDSFNIEKGLFFPRDFSVSYDDVTEVHDNDMIVTLHSEEMKVRATAPLQGGEPREYGHEASLAGTPSAGFGLIDELNRGGEIEIPLREEELRVQKTEQQRSEVHLKKIVHTEDRTVTIPVKSEELVIERTGPAVSGEGTGLDEMAFKEEDLTIPLMEEHVEVLTSQHIRETVHVKKEPHMENQEVKGQVRIEDVEVETRDKGAVKGKSGL